MSSVPQFYIGIDFHQSFCTVCILDASGETVVNQNCDSSASYIHKFVKWTLVKEGDVQLDAAVEACSGSAKLAEDLRQHGWNIYLAHAATVARLGKHVDKTDGGDAHVLADLVRVGYLPRVYLAPERQRQLRSLVRYRQQLAKQRGQIKLRVRGLMREAHLRITECSAWTKQWMATLRTRMAELGEYRSWICQQYLDELQHVIKKLVAAEGRLRPAVAAAPYSDRLLAQSGIGLVTAAMLLAEIGDFTRFRNGKQLARYCGLAPVNCSSGERQRQSGIGKACNGDLRRVLIEASHRLSRYVPHWKRMKRHLVGQGKKRSVATVAVANRWLRRLHFEMTHPTTIAQEELAA